MTPFAVTFVHKEMSIAAREGVYKTISKKIYDESVSESIIKQDEELKDILNELGEEISGATEEAGRSYEELYDDIIQWIVSRDPVR